MTQVPDIRLDRAEFEEPRGAAACAVCSNPFRDHYYEVNGQTVCGNCSETIRLTATGRGTRAGRFVRALAAGTAAAFGGSLLYWAILALTGYEFGLIAVVVGFAVGKAVNWGSHGKGGWRYQTLAMALTYLAMVSAYVPLVIADIAKAATSASAEAGSTAAAAPTAGAQPASNETPTFAGAMLALLILIAFICALPFLAGIENILGILILAFGLYEAWKLNRRVELVITGPHALAAPQTV